MFYIQQKKNGSVTTMAEAITFSKAQELLAELTIATEDASYYVSTQATKEWYDRAETPNASASLKQSSPPKS